MGSVSAQGSAVRARNPLLMLVRALAVLVCALAVVAPGIAEALVATAFGLAAAIPAVMAYNHFTNQVKLFGSDMDDFAMEFLNIVERNFT